MYMEMGRNWKWTKLGLKRGELNWKWVKINWNVELGLERKKDYVVVWYEGMDGMVWKEGWWNVESRQENVLEVYL